MNVASWKGHVVQDCNLVIYALGFGLGRVAQAAIYSSGESRPLHGTARGCILSPRAEVVLRVQAPILASLPAC